VDALDTIGDAADLKLKLDAWLELWSARVTISQFDSLRELGENAAALARHLDDGPRLAQVKVRQAQAIVYLGVIPGALEAGVEMAREAFARAEPGDVRTRSYAQFIVGNAYRELGRLADAVREFHTGISLFDGLARHSAERGLVFPICVSLGAWCAEAEASRGTFKEALESARRALQLATDINHVNSVSVASSYLGYVHVLRGEFATAVPLLERGIAIAIEQKLPRRPGEALPYLAYALVMLGQREQGLDCLARARQASTAEKAHWSAYGALRAAAYLAANCPDEAKDEIQRGLTEANVRNALGYRGPLRCLEGEVLAPVDSAAALDRFGEALVLATELGMRPHIAHCHLGLGKLSRRTGKSEQAQEHLTTATTMYREMSMRFWLEKAEAELPERS
jgi:tetratricopeptide (TPR) repeat protein